MEQISNALQNVAVAIKQQKPNESVCVVAGKQMNCFVDENGKFAISAYQDEVATNEQIKSLLELIFAAYGFSNDEKLPMIVTVSRAKMTVNQLTDAINNILATQKFKPKPCEIVGYNQADETIEFFTEQQEYKMIVGAENYAFDHSIRENQINQIKHRNEFSAKYFKRIQTPKYTKESLYTFSEDGAKHANFLKKFLTMSDLDVDEFPYKGKPIERVSYERLLEVLCKNDEELAKKYNKK